MKKRKMLAQRIFIFITLFACLFSVFLSISVFAGNSHDYSLPGYSGASYNETVDSLELLRDELELNVGTVEAAYLTERGDFFLTYPKNIPTSYINLYEIGQSLVVAAKAYTYTSADGVIISWIPKTVKAEFADFATENFPSVPDSEGDYIANFYSAPADASFIVEYKAKISISSESVNSVLSKAYTDAQYLHYLKNLAEYESALTVYNKYVSDKRIYDELYAEYLMYLEELKDYEADKARFDEYVLAMQKYDADYILYRESLEKAESLADEIAAYNAYLAKMEKINYRLSLVEDMKRNVTSLNRSLYAAITGGAVDQVLAEEALLTGNVVGADKDAVKNAEDATVEIRAFFEGYFALETDVEKYRFYQVNYNSFKDNIVKLFRALENLYENNMVRSMISSMDKSEKYEILLAQLYFAANALSDEPVLSFDGSFVFDSDYKIQTVMGKKAPADILGVNDYYPDKNIATPPADEAYPDPVPAPDYTPVPEPQKPEKVTEPISPEEVTEPKAPAVVAEPKAPAEVENVNGIEAAAPFAPSSLEAKLVNAYLNGELLKRSERAEALVLELTIPVTKVLGAESVTVTYHDANENVVGYVIVEAGTFADINYVPEKPDSLDGKYYTFEKWVSKDGKAVDLSSVSSDINVYPSFKQQTKEFDITWKIGETSVTQKFQYGAVPGYSGIPALSGDLNKNYRFVGWSPNIESVSGNAAYTAVFEEFYTMPDLAPDSVALEFEALLGINCGNKLSEKLDISKLLEISAGKYALVFKFRTEAAPLSEGESESLAQFTVSYADVIAMKNEGVRYIEFLSAENETEAEYSVSLYKTDGEPVAASFKMNAVVATAHSDSAMRLFYFDDNVKTYVRSSYSNGKISFNLNTGRRYFYIFEVFPNNVSIFPQEGIALSVDKKEAFAGDIVSVECTVPVGTNLIALYYIAEDGSKVYIENGKFEMPSYAVSVGAEFKKTVYTVKFVSDDMVISSSLYYYGDTVKVPEGVVKANDELYSYTFKGWSPAVTSVTGDAKYEAVYEKTLLDKKQDDGIKISEGTLKLLVTAVLFASIIIFAAVPSAVISVAFAIKRRSVGTAVLRFRKKY